MKINVTKDMARFIINSDKRKVVCILNNTAPMFLFYAQENLPITTFCDTGNEETSRLYNRLLMPNKFVGIATCSTDDEFDVEKGKLVAFSRAKDKLHASFFKRANLYINSIDAMLNRSIDSINRYGEKLEANSERRHNKIESVIGKE